MAVSPDRKLTIYVTDDMRRCLDKLKRTKEYCTMSYSKMLFELLIRGYSEKQQERRMNKNA